MYQPLSIESSSPMDAVYKAMAARVAEEEQTQRTMIALNEMNPSYPGKTNKEVKAVLDEVWHNKYTSRNINSPRNLALALYQRTL